MRHFLYGFAGVGLVLTLAGHTLFVVLLAIGIGFLVGRFWENLVWYNGRIRNRIRRKELHGTVIRRSYR